MNAISFATVSTAFAVAAIFSPTIPGPLAAVKASSPIKKSKSSVPLFAERLLPPATPVRNEGLFATAGLPEPEPPAPPTPPFVAIAVGKTKEGESLPANPFQRKREEVRTVIVSRKAYPALKIQYH